MTRFHERNAKRRQEVLSLCDRSPETEFAYLAGFFDGEGSVMVDARKVYSAGRPNRNHHQSPTVVVKVGNTDPKPLLRFQKVFGGRVYREPDVRALRNKPIYSYRAYENMSRVILERLLPHLTTKRPQAELALKLYRLKETLSPKDFSQTPELFELVQRLRLLNNTNHLRNPQSLEFTSVRPALSPPEEIAVAGYLTSADVRLVDRSKTHGLKWFRIRDASREPLDRIRAAFGGSVVRKGQAYYYSTTTEKALRILKRLAHCPNFSVLRDIAATVLANVGRSKVDGLHANHRLQRPPVSGRR